MICLFIVIAVSGCSSKQTQPSLLERNGIDVISSSSDAQMTFIKQHGNVERYCAARQSDVADTSSTGISFGAGTIGDSANVSDGSSQGALSLGGRDPAVLIVREIMYRACELSMNLNADPQTTIDIYLKFMDVMKDIADNQKGNGTTGLSQASTPTLKITETNTNATNSKKSNDSNSESKSDENSYDNYYNNYDSSDKKLD